MQGVGLELARGRAVAAKRSAGHRDRQDRVPARRPVRLRDADEHLMRAKREGRDRVVLGDSADV